MGMHELVGAVAGGMKELSDRMMELDEKVSLVKDRESMMEIGQGEPERRKSYAVVVRGMNERLTSAEVKQRMTEVMGVGDGVRIRSIKPTRSGGVVLETPTEADRRLVDQNPDLLEAGLRAEEPRRLDSRLLVYDVPTDMTDTRLLDELYTRNLRDMFPKEEFAKRVRVVRRLTRPNEKSGRVILQMPGVCKQKIMKDGRIYVAWGSYRVRPWEVIPRCFNCMGYDHEVKDCKAERLCYRCGRPGHRAIACKEMEDCPNCRARGRPASHSAMAIACPEHEWRLRLFKNRLNG